jgi:hypothetical protein
MNETGKKSKFIIYKVVGRILLEKMHTLGYYVKFDLLINLDINSLRVSN